MRWRPDPTSCLPSTTAWASARRRCWLACTAADGRSATANPTRIGETTSQKNGDAVFAIEYRLMKPEVKTWPGAVYDTKAAVQFVRAEAAEFGLDGERVGLIGDSAGAASVRPRGARGQGALILRRLPGGPTFRDLRRGEGGHRLLRRLRHAGAMGARPDDSAARPDRGEIPRRRAHDEPKAVLRGLAAQLRHARQEQHPLSSDLRELRRAVRELGFAVYVFCPCCGTCLPMTGGFTHSTQSVWSLMYRFAYRSATPDPLGHPSQAGQFRTSTT
jgi:hypothetical protein